MKAELQCENSKVVLTVDGKPFTEYRYGHYVCRPYFYPVLTSSGQPLTRGYPVESIEGETDDHFHHRGMWVAHGEVNGFDLWQEIPGHGCMLQRGDPEVGVNGGSAYLKGVVDWLGPEGEQLLEEERSIRVWATDDYRLIDHRSDLKAEFGDVCLGDTKEAGASSTSQSNTFTESFCG